MHINREKLNFKVFNKLNKESDVNYINFQKFRN